MLRLRRRAYRVSSWWQVAQVRWELPAGGARNQPLASSNKETKKQDKQRPKDELKRAKMEVRSRNRMHVTASIGPRDVGWLPIIMSSDWQLWAGTNYHDYRAL